MGTNKAGANQTNKKRPAFVRHPLRCTLALISDGWLRLEQRWEDNPGFVAMTAAGSLGLLLTAAMLINSGLGWLQDDRPAGDDVAVESPDSEDVDAAKASDAQSDLGDANDDEIFIAKGRKPNTKAFQDTDDADDDSDPSTESKAPARSIVSRIDEDAMDDADDNAAEPTTPVQIAKAKTPPQSKNPFDDDADGEAMEATSEPSTPEPEEEPLEVPAKAVAALPMQKPDSLDDDSPAETDEPEGKRPLPEMRVATLPEVSQSLDAEDEEDTTAAADQLADRLTDGESKSALKEPARLKRIETDERLDDESPKPARSINLVQAPAEKPAPRDDERWKQQQTKVAPENAAPAVAARQSRPVETKIFAPPKARPVQPNPVPPPAIQASSVLVAKESRPSRDNSAAPLLRLAISGPPSVGIGQPCQVEIQVTNTGSVAAKHLVVSAELPEGLVHDVAQSLEQQIETLAPGATYRALLRLRGEALGDKTIQAEVESADRAALQLSAKVRVTPASTTSTTIGTADCFCAPLVR